MQTPKLFNTEVRNRSAWATACRCLAALCFLTVLSTVAISQQTLPSDRGESDDPYTIKVSVGLVVLHATVRDHRRDLVSGLTEGDFQVYENGARQQIKHFSHEDIPVTVGLVIDNSGSMSPKVRDVIAAALAFARSSNPQDQMFVVNFNEHVRFALPRNTPFTDQPDQLQVALSRIKADGETALYDAIAAGLEHLKCGNRDKKVLIVISDGGDNASRHNLDQIMATARQSDAIIYTIGLFAENNPDKNPHVLKRLARQTGGEVFLPESLSQVVPICEQIARDIRSQYTIAYIPTDRKLDGTYRAIRVKAEAPHRGRLFVRTRAGYTAPLKPQTLSASPGDQP